MDWTDERVATLKKLWLDGLSASQIAKQLGAVTRNAVIGKCARLGLAGRATPSQPRRLALKAPRPPRPAPSQPLVARSSTVPAVSAKTGMTSSAWSSHGSGHRSTAPDPPPTVFRREEPGLATVMTIGAHMCKWPIGDPLTDTFTFCGRRQDEKTPYCLQHARIAYQPQATEKKPSGANDLARSLRRYV